MIVPEVSPSAATESVLSNFAKLFNAILWPSIALLILITQRKPITRLMTALTSLVESANEVKIWQIEIDRDIDKELDQTAHAAAERKLDLASAGGNSLSVPPAEISSAKRVESLVARFPASPARDELIDSVRQRMLKLASEYEMTRANMAAGRDRTYAMNEVFAQMRALAIAAKPFVEEFSRNDASAGQRLAAIGILQLTQNRKYIDWLAARMSYEQPFVFFQAVLPSSEQCELFAGKPMRSFAQQSTGRSLL